MALVLKRNIGEAVVINGKTRVWISQGERDGHLRLNFEAPPDVVILREELIGLPPGDRDQKAG